MDVIASTDAIACFDWVSGVDDDLDWSRDLLGVFDWSTVTSAGFDWLLRCCEWCDVCECVVYE